jgi:mRNA interferase YafQ
VRRTLLRSTTFVRAARRLLKRDPELADGVRETLEILSEDAFDPRLKTHKLKGEFDGSWACSVGYDLRILFEFVQHQEAEAILPQTIGTHDEVY